MYVMDNYLSAYVYLMLKDCQRFYRNVKSLNRVRDRKYTNTHTNIINIMAVWVYFVSETHPSPCTNVHKLYNW